MQKYFFLVLEILIHQNGDEWDSRSLIIIINDDDKNNKFLEGSGQRQPHMPCTSNWIKWDTEIGKVQLQNIELLFYIYIIYILFISYMLYILFILYI